MKQKELIELKAISRKILDALGLQPISSPELSKILQTQFTSGNLDIFNVLHIFQNQ